MEVLTSLVLAALRRRGYDDTPGVRWHCKADYAGDSRPRSKASAMTLLWVHLHSKGFAPGSVWWYTRGARRRPKCAATDSARRGQRISVIVASEALQPIYR